MLTPEFSPNSPLPSRAPEGAIFPIPLTPGINPFSDSLDVFYADPHNSRLTLKDGDGASIPQAEEERLFTPPFRPQGEYGRLTVPSQFDGMIKALRNGGATQKEIATYLTKTVRPVSRSTVGRIIRQMQNGTPDGQTQEVVELSPQQSDGQVIATHDIVFDQASIVPFGVASFIKTEDIPFARFPPGIQKSQDLLAASQYLFRFFLSDSDPRWQIAHAYLQAEQEARFKPLNFENALLATYLSTTSSYRNRYGSFLSEANIRHLCRAIHNVGAYPYMKELYESQHFSPPEPFNTRLAKTHSVNLGRDQRGITGCPEALYQLQLFENDKTYLGRIGFNIHKENGSLVVSITNVQGIPGAHERYQEIQKIYGLQPFNALIQQLKAMAEESKQRGTLMILRGLRNPKKTESSALYNALFKKEKISRFSFRRE